MCTYTGICDLPLPYPRMAQTSDGQGSRRNSWHPGVVHRPNRLPARASRSDLSGDRSLPKDGPGLLALPSCGDQELNLNQFDQDRSTVELSPQVLVSPSCHACTGAFQCPGPRQLSTLRMLTRAVGHVHVEGVEPSPPDSRPALLPPSLTAVLRLFTVRVCIRWRLITGSCYQTTRWLTRLVAVHGLDGQPGARTRPRNRTPITPLSRWLTVAYRAPLRGSRRIRRSPVASGVPEVGPSTAGTNINGLPWKLQALS